MIEPAGRQAEVLREPDGGVGREVKLETQKPSTIGFGDARDAQEFAQRGPDPPLRGPMRKAFIRHGRRRAENDAVIRLARRARHQRATL